MNCEIATSLINNSNDDFTSFMMISEKHFQVYQDDEEVQRDSGNSSNCSSSNSSNESSISKNINYEFEQEFESNTESQTPEQYFNLNKAPVDFNLLNDDRGIENLLFLEDFYRVHSNYFLHVQTEIKPWMRKTLANWMLEVCKNQSREEDVFVIAINILDRFLSVQTIGKRHLQLLGTVCMFIAAKLRSAVQFSAETLVIYTANSITIEDLLNWEQFVLQKLRWDINAVTAYDYVPFLLNKLNIVEHKNIASIRQYLSTFISLCSTEFKFSMLPASMVASGCLFMTIKYLNNLNKSQCEQILSDIHSITNCIDLELLVQCIEQIEDLISNDLKLKFQLDNNQIDSEIEMTSF